ncbi:MAG: hypothetical protein GXO02_01665, partial [Epsilonproteobacteria bacterium]|nr:hypothetical protein [Campylobacterota bacterium]
MKKEKLFALLTSIGVYLALVTIVGYIFLSKDEIKKSPHYVVKNSKILEVSLGTPNTKSNLLNSNKKRGVKKKQQKRKKVKKRVKKRRVKKVRNISSKRVAKRVKRAKKVTKKVKKKKIDK